MEYEIFTFNNGIRLIHKQVHSPVAHFGLVVNTGSRDETDQEHGLAHFIEHVFFKGTQRRKAYHIISRVEDVGGELDAYTTKEETAIHASFLKEYYARTMELISDIAFHSVFPPKELEKEKEVVLDEINSYKDSPAELIYDDFEDLVFQHHSLGRNILGRPETIQDFTRDTILQFLQRNYTTNEIVLCSVGDITFKKLVKLAEKYFGSIAMQNGTRSRNGFSTYKPETRIIIKDTHQAHCILGNLAYPVKDDRRIAMALVNDILGGPGMNSRLNMAIREKHGYTYSIESFYSTYSDTGITGIYFGSDPENLEKCIALIKKTLLVLQTQKLGLLQLDRAKRQLTGQLAIASENNSALMLTLGKSLLTFNRVDSLEEINARIRAVKTEDILDIANEVWNLDKLSFLIYK